MQISCKGNQCALLLENSMVYVWGFVPELSLTEIYLIPKNYTPAIVSDERFIDSSDFGVEDALILYRNSYKQRDPCCSNW